MKWFAWSAVLCLVVMFIHPIGVIGLWDTYTVKVDSDGAQKIANELLHEITRLTGITPENLKVLITDLTKMTSDLKSSLPQAVAIMTKLQRFTDGLHLEHFPMIPILIGRVCVFLAQLCLIRWWRKKWVIGKWVSFGKVLLWIIEILSHVTFRWLGGISNSLTSFLELSSWVGSRTEPEPESIAWIELVGRASTVLISSIYWHLIMPWSIMTRIDLLQKAQSVYNETNQKVEGLQSQLGDLRTEFCEIIQAIHTGIKKGERSRPVNVDTNGATDSTPAAAPCAAASAPVISPRTFIDGKPIVSIRPNTPVASDYERDGEDTHQPGDSTHSVRYEIQTPPKPPRSSVYSRIDFSRRPPTTPPPPAYSPNVSQPMPPLTSSRPARISNIIRCETYRPSN